MIVESEKEKGYRSLGFYILSSFNAFWLGTKAYFHPVSLSLSSKIVYIANLIPNV